MRPYPGTWSICGARGMMPKMACPLRGIPLPYACNPTPLLIFSIWLATDLADTPYIFPNPGLCYSFSGLFLAHHFSGLISILVIQDSIIFLVIRFLGYSGDDNFLGYSFLGYSEPLYFWVIPFLGYFFLHYYSNPLKSYFKLKYLYSEMAKYNQIQSMMAEKPKRDVLGLKSYPQ